MCADRPSAGKLTERVTIARRIEMNPDAPNDYGNTVAGWADEGTVAAEFRYAGGGETVMAARLAGRSIMKVVLRSSSITRQIDQTCQIRDARRGTIYQVNEVDSVTNPAWVYLVVESGVAG